MIDIATELLCIETVLTTEFMLSINKASIETTRDGPTQSVSALVRELVRRLNAMHAAGQIRPGPCRGGGVPTRRAPGLNPSWQCSHPVSYNAQNH